MSDQALDPQAVALAKAIRQAETGGDFTASGASGEYGAYQYTEPTWKAHAALAGVTTPLNQASPEEQNKVAYTYIKKRKDEGANVGEIASEWNSGDPQAYLRNHRGVNKYGVKYDTPAYAEKVARYYQQMKQNPGAQPPVTPSTIGHEQYGTPDAQPDNRTMEQKVLDAATKVSDFIGGRGVAEQIGSGLAGLANPELRQYIRQDQPITDTLGSAIQVGANIGTLPAGGEGLATTIGAKGLLPKIFTGIKEGALVGSPQLGGVSAGEAIEQGKSPRETLVDATKGAFTGAALGGGLGGSIPIIGAPFAKVGNTIKRRTPEGARQALTETYDEVFGARSPFRKIVQDAFKYKDTNLSEFLAGKAAGSDGAVLKSNSDGVIDTLDLQDKLERDLKPLYAVRKELLKQYPDRVSLDDLAAEAKRRIDTPENRGKNIVGRLKDDIDKEIAMYKSKDGYGDSVSLEQLQDIKIGQRDISKVFRSANPDFPENPNYILSDVAKEKLENITGDDVLKDLNNYISKHIDAQKLLQKMEKGRALVKGGKIGKAVFSNIGALAGHATGMGPVAAILGGVVGDHLSGMLLSNAITTPLKRFMLELAERENPGVIERVFKVIKDKELARELTPKLPAGNPNALNLNENGAPVKVYPEYQSGEYVGKGVAVNPTRPANPLDDVLKFLEDIANQANAKALPAPDTNPIPGLIGGETTPPEKEGLIELPKKKS